MSIWLFITSEFYICGLVGKAMGNTVGHYIKLQRQLKWAADTDWLKMITLL